MVKFILGIVFGILALIFIFQNMQMVDVTFLAWTITTSRALMLLIILIVGFLLAFPIAKTNIKGQPGSAVVINLIKAELVKLLFIIVTLWAAFKFYDDIQPFGLVLGLAISALMSGLAISKLDKN